ncbi:unnamed protein product [Lepidochelys kempii]
MEKVLKESILKHLEERKVIRNRQHGFTKGSLDPSEGSSSPAVLCYPKEKTPVSQAARNGTVTITWLYSQFPYWYNLPYFVICLIVICLPCLSWEFLPPSLINSVVPLLV